jgi:hypothetical protein
VWFYDIIQASRRWREVALSFSCWLVSYWPLAFIDAHKRYVTPHDRGIDASDAQQHRNHSATRDASRRAAA